MGLPAEKFDYYTYEDLLDFPENIRAEIINGDVYMMPSPSIRHQRISAEIMFQLKLYLRGKRCEVFAAPLDVRLFERDGDRPEDVDCVVQPDILVVCDPDKLDNRGVKGAPDMVIEIVSPSDSERDRFIKYNLYCKAGVREYWIVDPAGTVHVFLLEGNFYNAAAFGNANDKLKVNVLEDCEIDLSLVFGE